MQKKAYSTSLRQLLGLKILPDINPDAIVIQKSHNQPLTFLKENKTSKQITSMRKELIKNKTKKHHLQSQINGIVKDLVEKDNLVNKKLWKRKNAHHYRIITENQGKQSTSKLPIIAKSFSEKKVRNRLKTDVSILEEGKVTYTQNINEYVKHYREGKSSIKKLKYRKKQV